MPSQDADAGLDPSGAYPTPSATNVPCSAQCHDSEEVDAAGRVTVERHWKILFAVNPGVKTRARVDIKDPATGTVTDSVYVEPARDDAGRGACFVVKGVQRV